MTAPESNFERTGKHRALCVDDSADVVHVVKDTLERALPVTVDTALSGADALVLLSRGDYDVLLSDYRMPGMDGLTFLRQARESARATPRVMITSDTDLDVAVRAINDGAITAFFRKPIDAATLVEKVGRILDERHHALVKERGQQQVAQNLRREIATATGKDVGRPFTGSLGDATRRS